MRGLCWGGWGHKCACVCEGAGGRVLGEGIRIIVLPPCFLQATVDIVWQLQGGTWRDQNKSQSSPFSTPPLPFCWGRGNQPFWSLCSGWLLALCQCRGAEGGQAGSVNAYHDHNRATEHSSAMKAQRERLRIPGLTLEWVFSSVTLPSGSSSAESGFPHLFVIFVAVFLCGLKLCAMLALAVAAASAAGSRMSNPSQLGNTGRLRLGVMRLCARAYAFRVYVIEGWWMCHTKECRSYTACFNCCCDVCTVNAHIIQAHLWLGIWQGWWDGISEGKRSRTLNVVVLSRS